MFQRKIFKTLRKKFQWNFLWLFFLTFLSAYLSFLIYFNLRNNLTNIYQTRGWFYYVFGRYPLHEKISGKIYVDWPKLLFILFLLYFPLKILIQFTLSYFQQVYERKINVYLTKKLLNSAYKNNNLTTKNQQEKILIITNTIPIFSQQFLNFPVSLFGIFTDIALELFSLVFLINSRNSVEIAPFIFIFALTNLIWFAVFRWFFNNYWQKNEQKKKDFEQAEKTQIKIFLQNLNTNNKPGDLAKLNKSLDHNSEKFRSVNFTSLVFNLPNLIIPGLVMLFLYTYYNFFLGGKGSLNWNTYFVALSLQRIFLALRKMFNLLLTFSDMKRNQQKLEKFFE